MDPFHSQAAHWLLVSQPAEGRVVLLTPGPGGTGVPRTLLSGLTSPQGLAFARVAGRWVLYVAESDQIDRYRWNAGRISASPAVIAFSPALAAA